MATKATLKALEKVFAAEIECRLPFQSKAKIYEALYQDGLVIPMELQLSSRFGPNKGITVSGWELTHAGRFLYCCSCDETDQ